MCVQVAGSAGNEAFFSDWNNMYIYKQHCQKSVNDRHLHQRVLVCCHHADFMHCSAAFEVPFALLTLVEKDTAVKKWLINSLHVTHMTDGAPIVKISAANPVGYFQGPDFLIDMFNNPKRHPDLIISVNSQDILVHKMHRSQWQ